MSVAIIPARAGSKRIPKKNIKPFLGKPIIAYSIEVAKKCELFDRIIVSTDSEEISKVAQKCGAEVPFMRPSKLSDDYTGTDDVIKHALNWLESNGDTHEFACCIYATAPFLRVDYLKKGYALLLKENASQVFSVTTFPYPIFRALKANDNNRVEMVWPEHRKTRSQDLPEVCHDAGQFYWLNVEKYCEENQLPYNDSVPLFLPRSLVQDIDTQEDWDLAEKMFKANSDISNVNQDR